MITAADVTYSNIMQSALWGALRGGAVETLIYPLEVLKIQQQCAEGRYKNQHIIQQLLQKEGYRAFYRGLLPQLLKISVRQAWCWPMITEIPKYLETYRVGLICQQALTGLAIASVDALVTTPLERAKIFSTLAMGGAFSLKNAWQGLATYGLKRSINMVTFLVAQEWLRERQAKKTERITPLNLIKIGSEVALIVSLVAAPFDVANTLRQAQKRTLYQCLTRRGILSHYRGWTLNALTLVVHNIASVLLIEKLKRGAA